MKPRGTLMASSATDTVRDLGRRLVNRAETVVGDDAREGVSRAKAATARSVVASPEITAHRESLRSLILGSTPDHHPADSAAGE